MFTIFAQLNERELMKSVSFDEMVIYLNQPKSVFWIDVEDPADEEMEELQEVFGFHPLCIEDCLYNPNSPKIDEFDSYIFIILNEPIFDDQKQEVIQNELDFFLGKNYLVSVHKGPNQTIEKIKKRMQTDLVVHQSMKFQRGQAARAMLKENLIFRNSDFIFHAVFDTMIDQCFPIVDRWDDMLDVIEESMLSVNDPKMLLNQLMSIKRQLTQLRRLMGPHRDIISRLIHTNNQAVSKMSLMFFRDIYDHTIRLNEFIDSHRDSVTNILETYYSYQSHLMNENSQRINLIMQRLTIITTIFMPLSFIAGVYGMNFTVLPEKDWEYGYPAVLLLMAGVASFMYFFFKKRKWFQ